MLKRDYPTFVEEIRSCRAGDAYAAVRDLEVRARSAGSFDAADRMRELADAIGGHAGALDVACGVCEREGGLS